MMQQERLCAACVLLLRTRERVSTQKQVQEQNQVQAWRGMSQIEMEMELLSLGAAGVRHGLQHSKRLGELGWTMMYPITCVLYHPQLGLVIVEGRKGWTAGWTWTMKAATAVQAESLHGHRGRCNGLTSWMQL